MSRNPRIDNRRSLHIISKTLYYVFLKISLSFLKNLKIEKKRNRHDYSKGMKSIITYFVNEYIY